MRATSPLTKRTKQKGASPVGPAPEAAEGAMKIGAGPGAEQTGEPLDSALDRLMRRALAGRRRMQEAQSKLRRMEVEIRGVSGEKRSRFERLRAAALEEYRNARAEALRARNQLLSSLKLLPGRS